MLLANLVERNTPLWKVIFAQQPGSRLRPFRHQTSGSQFVKRVIQRQTIHCIHITNQRTNQPSAGFNLCSAGVLSKAVAMFRKCRAGHGCNRLIFPRSEVDADHRIVAFQAFGFELLGCTVFRYQFDQGRQFFQRWTHRRPAGTALSQDFDGFGACFLDAD